MPGYYCGKALFEGVVLVAMSDLFVTHNCSASDWSRQTIFQEGLYNLAHYGRLLSMHVIIMPIKQAALSQGSIYRSDCASHLFTQISQKVIGRR